MTLLYLLLACEPVLVEYDQNSCVNTWVYIDEDQDGFGDRRAWGCPHEALYVSFAGDCDDEDPDAWPGATWYLDEDGDGFFGTESMESCLRPDEPHAQEPGEDCDDQDPEVHPEALEICDNNVDDDCNDGIDERECD